MYETKAYVHNTDTFFVVHNEGLILVYRMNSSVIKFVLRVSITVLTLFDKIVRHSNPLHYILFRFFILYSFVVTEGTRGFVTK